MKQPLKLAGGFLAAAVLALTACATRATEISIASGGTCATPGVRIDADFEGGSMQDCRAAGPREFDIVIRPEDIPINPSPWYAIRITPTEPGPVRVNLRYEEDGHRYRPQTSPDGEFWAYLDDDAIAVSEDEMTASLTLVLSDAPVFLAGQELFTSEDYADWIGEYAGRGDLDITTIGHSIANRPISMITSRPDSSRGSIILIGRQHPPEVTGAQAMQTFVGEVLGDSELARNFRETFTLVIIPVMNPDGVDLGHWRHNLGGTDLNRDWGPFAQPETQAALRVIDDLADNGATRPVLFLDFHSTNRDVFYTQLEGEDGTEYGFTEQWMERAGTRLPGYAIERAERHQSDLPTAKNYMFARFNIPSITYEIGDNTEREIIRQTAVVFAQEMMTILLLAEAEHTQ